MVLTGANGAGKTTLLRTLAGFLKPVCGTILIEGGDPEKLLIEQIHFAGHANAVKPHLTVKENAAFWAEFLEAPSGETIDKALRHFGLLNLADFPAAYLSAGQKRRVCLARLLVAPRPVWLLDEPTVSLDADSSRLLADAVNAHTKSGGIVIAATHTPLGLDRARNLKLESLERAA